MNKLEIRTSGTFEKVDGESRKIHGLAIVAESKSQLLRSKNHMFYEMIQRSAINDDIIKNNDIKLYMNHDSQQGTLARSKYGEGSLKLFITERGLEFETELPETEKGNELLRGIERGDYDAISFAFIAGQDHYDEKPNEDGSWNRYIDSFNMIDEISVLSCAPAYLATEVSCRSLDDIADEYDKRAQEEEAKKEEERINAIHERNQAILKDLADSIAEV
ncbi:HK97 family phage prohead protease [Sharpea azabuensis]|uniref:HK97 family phage prohead protease n=1 Tax=Sharpea azabuensis TaxID=322505 RepID=UPI002E812F0E|nr:HK97 family phage prohead protease [Sharpea azabuensis]MEE3309483.1 HK97 family phage prohead protease [Sharpea azabuensis]